MALTSLRDICLEISFFKKSYGHFLKHKKLFCIKMLNCLKCGLSNPNLNAVIWKQYWDEFEVTMLLCFMNHFVT